jgi:hypothetical protein
MEELKKKAKELIKKFGNKKYALLCVDEILESWRSMFGKDEDKQPDIVYWQKIRQEILNM